MTLNTKSLAQKWNVFSFFSFSFSFLLFSIFQKQWKATQTQPQGSSTAVLQFYAHLFVVFKDDKVLQKHEKHLIVT